MKSEESNNHQDINGFIERLISPSIKHIVIRLTIALVALTMGISFPACTRTDHNSGAPIDKVTIAYATVPNSGLAAIALKQDYYKQEGLETVTHLHPYGKPALQDLLDGKADFATVAETPLVFAIMNGEKISIIATIESMNTNNAIIARRDRGILTPGDLKGKRIGMTAGTTSDFFMDAFLSMYGNQGRR